MHSEELGFVCEDGSYLFYFDSEDEGEYCKIEKNRPTLPNVEYPCDRNYRKSFLVLRILRPI